MTTLAPPVLLTVPGGVCAVPGIRAAGVTAGLKASGSSDLALVVAEATVAATAAQTANQVKAAPVVLTARHVADGRARAVVINSGNANACTGTEGMATAEATATAVAEALGCAPQDVLVASTGVIGVPLPRAMLVDAVASAVAALSTDGGSAAAQAILTTDTTVKETAVTVHDESGTCVVGGMAKGSGMIAPAFATMLAVVTTDAPLEGPVLKAAVRSAVDRTFGRISVDGCMSTNDAVLVLATGTAANPPSLAAFAFALETVLGRLAEAVVRDGEGAAKLVRLRVRGARSEPDAVRVGRAVAGSNLFQTAIAGGDPNWGRVLAAVGAGPVAIDPNRISVSFGGVEVCRFGTATAFDHGMADAALRGSEVHVEVDLDLGEAEATFLTCDLTHAYITINAEYTT